MKSNAIQGQHFGVDQTQNTGFGHGSTMGINALQKTIESLNASKVDDRKRKQLVCMHYLDGNCKKGDEECGYLHTYIPDKVPVCRLWRRGMCPNPETCKY